MNIFTKTKNNLLYANYSRLADKSLSKMEEHIRDEDSREFKKWAQKCLKYSVKCIEIPIK